MDLLCKHNVARGKACFSCYWDLPATIAAKPKISQTDWAKKSGDKVRVQKALGAEQTKTRKPAPSAVGFQIKRLSRSGHEIVKVVKKTKTVPDAS